MQTKLESFIEAWINVLIGFGINYAANMAILPAYGMQLDHSTNFQIGLLYTVISVARSYIVRRYFNSKIQTLAHKTAGAIA